MEVMNNQNYKNYIKPVAIGATIGAGCGIPFIVDGIMELKDINKFKNIKNNNSSLQNASAKISDRFIKATKDGVVDFSEKAAKKTAERLVKFDKLQELGSEMGEFCEKSLNETINKLHKTSKESIKTGILISLGGAVILGTLGGIIKYYKNKSKVDDKANNPANSLDKFKT